jgi:hypothetical protein
MFACLSQPPQTPNKDAQSRFGRLVKIRRRAALPVSLYSPSRSPKPWVPIIHESSKPRFAISHPKVVDIANPDAGQVENVKAKKEKKKCPTKGEKKKCA